MVTVGSANCWTMNPIRYLQVSVVKNSPRTTDVLLAQVNDIWEATLVDQKTAVIRSSRALFPPQAALGSAKSNTSVVETLFPSIGFTVLVAKGKG